MAECWRDMASQERRDEADRTSPADRAHQDDPVAAKS
jgi:hypothetical protein